MECEKTQMQLPSENSEGNQNHQPNLPPLGKMENEVGGRKRKWRTELNGNEKFGRLTIVNELSVPIGIRRTMKCVCECGNIVSATLKDLRRGNTKSCGCLLKDTTTARNTKHGYASRVGKTPEYKSWLKMIRRCHNESDPAFKDYGGRGIFVYEPWRTSFVCFLEHVGIKPSPIHSIDRIKNNEGYFPGNVKWSTPKEQANNRRSNHILEFNGISKNLTEWGIELGIKSLTLLKRLSDGWTVEETLTRPLGSRTKRKTNGN